MFQTHAYLQKKTSNISIKNDIKCNQLNLRVILTHLSTVLKLLLLCVKHGYDVLLKILKSNCS